MNISKAYFASIVYLIILLIGSIIFYKERVLFADPAFITFEIINTKNFIFSEHRYGAFITQIFPLVGAIIGAPLKFILISYSLSFYLFYLFVALISGYVLKQYRLAILFIFYFCFIVSDSYFWPNNEIHQAVGWMVLFMSLFRSSCDRNWNSNKLIHCGIISTLFLATISHLLIVPTLLYLWFYDIIERYKFKIHIKQTLVYSLLILSFVLFRLWLSHNSWYDGVKLEGVKQINIENILKALNNNQVSSFTHLLLTKYWTLLILMFVGMISLILRKKYIQLSLTIVFSIGYFLLIALTYSESITDNNLFYFESQWMGLALIVCTPFLYETTKLIKNKKVLIMAFVLIYVTKIPDLFHSYNKFDKRLSSLETIVNLSRSKNLQKSYINNNEELTNAFLITWGLPIESILLSSLDEKELTASIKSFKKDYNVSSSSDSIYTAFKFIPLSELNPRYFSIPNDKPYAILENTTQ